MGCNGENNSTGLTENNTEESSEDSKENDVNIVRPSFSESLSQSLAIVNATNRYDKHFRKYTEMFIPYIDWRYLKSLCWVESHFKPAVISGKGAVGLCQFMPATFQGYKEKLNVPQAQPTDAKYSIMFAAAYVQYLNNFWSSPRPKESRLKIVTASYNAGQQRLLQAQKLCQERNGVAILYEDIIICLVDITGPDNSSETINHVIRVWKNWRALLITG